MVWGAFSQHQTLKLTIVEGKVDSIKYTELQKTTLLPFNWANNTFKFTFQ